MGASSRCLGRCAHSVLRRHHRHLAKRHQEGVGLLDHQPARLHVPGGRHRRLCGRDLPHGHPRLLQGAVVPRRRLGDPRHGQRSRHASLRHAPQVHAHHGGHLHRWLAGDRRRASIRRVLVERRNPRAGLERQQAVVAHRVCHRDPHRLLHEPRSVPHLLRSLPLRRHPRRRGRRDVEQPDRCCRGWGRGRRGCRNQRRPGSREGRREVGQSGRETRAAPGRTGRLR